MAIDSQAVVSKGYWNNDATQLTLRVVSFGYWQGIVVPPVLINRIRGNYMTVQLQGQMRL